MKEIQVELGRRGFFGDDFLTIYQELDKQSLAVLKDLPNCILSGCVVTPNTDRYDVSAGLVWIDGRVMPFAGATYYAFPAEIVAATPVVTQEVYEVGTPDDVYIDYNATIRAALGTGSFIALSASSRNDFYEQIRLKLNVPTSFISNWTLVGAGTDFTFTGQGTLTGNSLYYRRDWLGRVYFKGSLSFNGTGNGRVLQTSVAYQTSRHVLATIIRSPSTPVLCSIESNDVNGLFLTVPNTGTNVTFHFDGFSYFVG